MKRRQNGAGITSLIDHHWPWAVIVLFGAPMAGGYSAASLTSTHPTLLGALDPTTRGIFYGSLATSAGALLGLIIASLAILLTLDESRDRVKEMRELLAWRILNRTLLTAAAFMAVTLALSTLALALDSSTTPWPSIETAVASVATVAFFELIVGGLAFAVVVLKLVKPQGASTST